MTNAQMRALSEKDLEARTKDLQREVFDLKMKLRSGRLDSTADLDKTKKELARALTLTRERALGIRREAK
jgi:large subunit ribosomal protein L29